MEEMDGIFLIKFFITENYTQIYISYFVFITYYLITAVYVCKFLI